MPQQWNQWEFPVTIRAQHDMYWGTLPETFQINFPPLDTWAYSQLSTIRIFDEHESDLAFGEISFTEYSYIDENRVQRRVDVSKPRNYYLKTNYIWSYQMVSLTVESLGRNVGARGLVIVEFWSAPNE